MSGPKGKSRPADRRRAPPRDDWPEEQGENPDEPAVFAHPFTQAHARGLVPPVHLSGEPPSIEERVRYIGDLLVRGMWSSKMARQLAGEWGISTDMVRRSSAEASRLVKLSRGDLDEQREANIARAESAYEAAMTCGDWKAAIAAIKQIAEITGTAAPAKFALTDKAGNDLLPPEIRQLLRVLPALPEVIETTGTSADDTAPMIRQDKTPSPEDNDARPEEDPGR